MATDLRWISSQGLLFVFLVTSLLQSPNVSNAIQLTTKSPKLVGVGNNPSSSNKNSVVQDFISRPVHWPEIVLSSNRAELIKKSKSKVDTLEVGDTVVEFFALNQFQVEWTCKTNEPGKLVVVSPNGVPGIAKDCIMGFEFEDADDDDTSSAVVRLTMEYTPESPLAVLATPALFVDNWLALNVLLPAAVDTKPLDSYRKLMGILYGIAGTAHLVDLLVGGSQLFTTVVGIPPFENLDFIGQVYALVWCAVGPISYYFSTTANNNNSASPVNMADVGLVLYGVVELLGAVLSSGITGAAPDVVSNAAGVQAIVLAAWVYSYQKQQEKQLE